MVGREDEAKGVPFVLMVLVPEEEVVAVVAVVGMGDRVGTAVVVPLVCMFRFCLNLGSCVTRSRLRAPLGRGVLGVVEV